jgi:poly(ADP-ribose) glycohydrolase ARH3
MTIDIDAKFLGAMVGSALGDAVGYMAYRYPDRSDLLERVNAVERLTYTADTVMAVAMAETLIEYGGIETRRLGDSFLKHFANKPWQRQGAEPPEIYRIVEQEGIDYIYAARRLFEGEGSYGNGAAMRITPLGLFYYQSDDIYAQAQLSAQVTHTHPVGIDGAAVFAKALARTVTLKPQRPFSPQAFVDMLKDFARTDEMRNKLALIPGLLDQQMAPELAVEKLGNGVSASESVPMALFCFLRFPHSYLESVLCAITHGGKRDTMGIMAGALSGAYLGVDAISAEWRDKLEDIRHLEALARELAALAP